MINDESIKNMGLKAFIPQRFITCRETIGHVSEDITQENIINEAVASLRIYKVEILDARRLNRRIKKNNETKIIPSSCFQITFGGRSLLLSLSLFKAGSNYVWPNPRNKQNWIILLLRILEDGFFEGRSLFNRFTYKAPSSEFPTFFIRRILWTFAIKSCKGGFQTSSLNMFFWASCTTRVSSSASMNLGSKPKQFFWN